MYDPVTNKISRDTRFGTSPDTASGQYITQAAADRQIDDLITHMNDALAQLVRLPAGSITKEELDAAVSDGDVMFVEDPPTDHDHTPSDIETVGGNVVLTRAEVAAGPAGETTLGLGTVLGRGDSGNVAQISMGANLGIVGTSLKVKTAAANVVLTRADAAAGEVTETPLAPSKLMGRGSTGDVTQINPGTGLSIDGTTLNMVRKTHVIFATGQSNISGYQSYSWTPAANCFLWDFDGAVDAATDVGTAFAAMPTNLMAYGYSYANEVAKANPDWDVYLINVGNGGQPISKWMTGGPSPDVYATCKTNVEAALAVLDVDFVDEMLWWQGEADIVSTTYTADFETVHARFKAETWFEETTPVTLTTLSRNYLSGIQAPFNTVLRTLVQTEPATRRLSDVGGLLAAQSWWAAADYIHCTAEGYEAAGKIAFGAIGAAGAGAATLWRAIVKRTNTSRTSTAALADDPHLKFSMKSGRSYIVRGKIVGFGSATPDFKWGMVGPTATTIINFGQTMKQDTIATVVGDFLTAYPSGVAVAQGADGQFSVEFEIRLLPVTADGTFAFQWAQNTSDAAATVVWAGSYIEYIEFG